MAFGQKKMELSPRLKFGVGKSYSQNQILKIAAVICLILATILGINAVRLIVKNTSQPLTSNGSPAVLGASDVKQPDATPTVQFTNYTVQKNDTLFDISQKMNINWTTLASLNNLKSPFNLKPGQVLKVPVSK